MSHESSSSKTVIWLTPPSIIEALGGWKSFDLDPCAAPEPRPWPTARRMNAQMDGNGLMMDWEVLDWFASDGTPCECICHVRSAAQLNRRLISVADPAAIASEDMQAGAGVAPLITPSKGWPKSAPTRPQQSLFDQPVAGTPRAPKDERLSGNAASSTTTDDASGCSPLLSNGRTKTGRRVSKRGQGDAPTATRAGRSNKSTLSPLATQPVPARSPETCSPPAHDAILPSARSTRLTGWMDTASTARCDTCRDCRAIRNSNPRVFLNPPYDGDRIGGWIAKLAQHGRGTALLAVRTDNAVWHTHVWGRASAMLFLRGRIRYCTPDGKFASGRAGHASVLVAYGDDDRDRLAACGIDGHFETITPRGSAPPCGRIPGL